MAELKLWSFYRALIGALLFLYMTVATVIGHKKQSGSCDGFGILGIAWAFGGMIFILVYCTASISDQLIAASSLGLDESDDDLAAKSRLIELSTNLSSLLAASSSNSLRS